MRNRNKYALVLVGSALAGSLALPAAARDREFSAAVHHIESTYHVHRNLRFLMWGVGLMVKVAHPEGVRNLRMAIFEDQNFSAVADDIQFTLLLESSMNQTAADHGTEAWQRMVRVWSRNDNERTYIYARPRGKDLELFIVALETDEAVVLKLRMDPDKLDEMVDQHRSAGRGYIKNSALASPLPSDQLRGN